MSLKAMPRIPFLLLFALLPLMNCRQAEKGNFQTVRFIDLLKKESILRSPFLRGGDSTIPHLYPRSAPLADWGSGDNPFNLKRKLDLGTVVLDILFSPPRSEYSFNVHLPADSVLEIGAGIVRDKNFEKLRETLGQESRGVQFIVELEVKGRKKNIFHKFHPLPEKQEYRTLNYSFHKLDLPRQEQDVRLTFVTAGEEGPFSFWYNPVIYTKGRSGRSVILISLDTLRADHLGCYGYSRPTSPNSDALSRDSVLFEHTYAASNWTLPAHVSLMTSLSGPSHGVYFGNERIDSSNIMLAEVLRQKNFFCTAVTGAGYVSSFFGFSRGFETYREGEGFISHQNSAELVAGVAAEWLQNNRDKDFFLFLHTYQTHNPYACPPPYSTMFLGKDRLWERLDLLRHLGGRSASYRELPAEERENIVGLYDGEILYTDESLIKGLIEKLKELDLYDQSMIILTSDHGEEFYEHGAWMHGPGLYDESIRVPLIIKFPDSRFRGKRIATLVRQVDIMPTVLDVMGIPAGELNLEGRSLLPVVQGKEKGDRTFLADAVYDTSFGNSRRGEEPDMIFPDKVAFGIKKNKLIFNRELEPDVYRFFSPPPPRGQAAELFDLETDPGEKRNLASQKADSVRDQVRIIQEVYKNVAKKRAKRIQVDEKLEEQLRALGYIR